MSEFLNFQHPQTLKSTLAQDEIFRTIGEWSLCIGERNSHILTSNCIPFEIRKKSRRLNLTEFVCLQVNWQKVDFVPY